MMSCFHLYRNLFLSLKRLLFLLLLILRGFSAHYSLSLFQRLFYAFLSSSSLPVLVKIFLSVLIAFFVPSLHVDTDMFISIHISFYLSETFPSFLLLTLSGLSTHSSLSLPPQCLVCTLLPLPLSLLCSLAPPRRKSPLLSHLRVVSSPSAAAATVCLALAASLTPRGRRKTSHIL